MRIEPFHIVSIDEALTKTNITPLCGRVAKGERLKAYVLDGRGGRLTYFAALRSDGLTAPKVFNSPINGESFRR